MDELNKQKEQLSVDLADRAAIICKLLEDNKALNEKLALAQREALRLREAARQQPMAAQ